jgi:DNA-binding IclR family transcriptional regulator
MLQTLTRAGRVLELFSPERPEWGATAVAKELRVSKSQAHELLVSLTDIGLLEREAPGRYRLGWRILALHSLFLLTRDIGRASADVMRALAGRYGETVELAVWGQGRAICIAAYKGRHAVAVSPCPVGAGMPGHCTGAGKMLLSSRSRDEVQEVVARDGLPRMTDRTIVTEEDLLSELSSVQCRGFAYEEGEHAPDMCGVAAPILNTCGDVIAAVSMSVPVRRWQRGKDEYTRTLVAAARGVSRRTRRQSLPQRSGDLERDGLVVLDPTGAAPLRPVRNSRTAIDSASAS